MTTSLKESCALCGKRASKEKPTTRIRFRKNGENRVGFAHLTCAQAKSHLYTHLASRATKYN